MGYLNSGTTTTLTAKLTPIGRQKLILTNNNLVTTFSLGDSDSNYYASLPLTTGQVPTDSGNIGPNSTTSNSVNQLVNIKSMLILNSKGATKKAVEESSINLTTDTTFNGQAIISGTNLTQNIICRSSGETDSLVNLFYTFNLPLSSSDDYNFTGKTYANGGFSDTAISGIAQTNIFVIGINNTQYGETIDGKAIEVQITTSSSTYTLYSTFQNSGMPLTVQDALYNDTSVTTKIFGDNISLMFSDNIKQPNGGNPSLSWGTGFGTIKPFSQNRKQQYNLVTNKNLSQSADTAVGIAYLDKGFIVITNQQIINEGIITSATVVTCNSLSTSVAQNITCISNRGEFGMSTNKTFSTGDTPRISEIGLYDNDGDLIAVAKPDRHIVKNVNEFLALGIKISL
jgi:hypothetical protein